ncbi:sentrin-specific protease 1 [Podarcis lilfordi]|uniref:Sentrin-specific protease 1 n=1 Tax=Podarcis lilfordi TaxID=74358 RepID=A0AA35LN01_9SAUR|nr:sentrin-specific protease 1 [Podarcis lilfordi]
MTSTPKSGKEDLTVTNIDSFDSSPIFSTQSEKCLDKSLICTSVPPWHNCTFPILSLQTMGLVGSVANICVYDYDINTLKGSNWINDRIIDTFLASRVIMAKELGHDGTIFPLSCHFMQICQRLPVQALKNCLRFGVLKKDVLIIPVNDREVHWILIVIIFKRKTMLYLDSKHGLNHSVIDAITSFLTCLYEMDSKYPYSFADWSCFAPTDIPRQGNSSDYGPFTCTIAHLIASAAQLQFIQKNMAAIRPWIAKEIIQYCGKTYLEGQDKYFQVEIDAVPPKKRQILKESHYCV